MSGSRSFRPRRALPAALLVLAAWASSAASAPAARHAPAARRAHPAVRRTAPARLSEQAALALGKEARVSEEAGAYARAADLLTRLRPAVAPDADLDLALALDQARCGRLDSAAALLWTPRMDRALVDSLPASRHHFEPWIREPLWVNGRFDGWHWYVARARFEVAFAQRRWAAARAAAEACAAARPISGSEWLALALAAGRDGDLEASRAAAERAVALDPALPEAQYVAGLFAWRAGRRAEAQQRFQAAIALDSLARAPAVALMRVRLPGLAPDSLPATFLTGVRAVGELISPERPKLEEFQQYDMPARLAAPARIPVDSNWVVHLERNEMILPVLIDEHGRAVAHELPWITPDRIPTEAVAALLGSLPDWRFVPAQKNGVPQRSWVTVPYHLQ